MITDHSHESLSGLDEHLVALQRPGSFDAEQYRRLRHRLERLACERGTRVVAVTSAVPGDGKTVTSINLAAALAESPSSRVLLIDADLRRPSVAGKLGVEEEKRPGLVEFLRSNNADLHSITRETGYHNLSVISSGACRSGSYELLTSPQFTRLLRQARQEFTFVVLDTPPLIAVSDATVLAPVVDGFLVVVAASSTPRKVLGEALNLLEPTSVLGLVFNRDDQPTFGYDRRRYTPYFEAESSDLRTPLS